MKKRDNQKADQKANERASQRASQKHKDGDELWQVVARTVNPMPQDTILPTSDALASLALKKVPKKATTKAKSVSSAVAASPSASISGMNGLSRHNVKSDLKPADLAAEKVSGISRTDAKRIKSGQVSPTARLDLHGLTSPNARSALRRFIAEKQRDRHQHVLVITGKGTAGKGVIRQSLPQWLDEPPLSEQVVAFHPAKPKDGGLGAWYIKLRQLP